MAENRELALILKLVADQFQSELKKSGGMLGDFNKFISDWKVQLTAAGGALLAIAKSTANYGEELLKTSQKVGINIESLAGLNHAANLADLSNDQLAQGLKFLSQNMVEAAQRTGDGASLFFRLGLSATDAQGKLRPTEEVLLDLADVFSKSADGAGKTEAAVKLFGKAGIDLIPFLNQGKSGIKDLMAEAQRLGLVMSKEDAEAANKFNDELKRLQAGMRGLTIQMGNELIPSFTSLIEVTSKIGGSAGGWIVTNIFKGLAEVITLANAELRVFIINLTAFMDKWKQPEFKAIIEAQRKLDVDGIYKSMNEQLIKIDPQAYGIVAPNGSVPSAGGGNDKKTINLKDQEKLGKALLELFLEQNRAIDIGYDLAVKRKTEDEQGLADTAAGQKRIESAEDHLNTVRQENVFKSIMYERNWTEEERDQRIENEQAWIAYYDQLGGGTDNFYTHKMNLLRAQLAKELDLNERQAANLLMAWQNYDSERAAQILAASPKTDAQKQTIELNTMRQSILNRNEAGGDVIEGWAEGMRKYVKDTQTGFGLAADMARRTAQLMEQSFKNFFFDAMEGKIKSFKDLLKSVLDFAKQIVAQIGAQLLTKQIAGAFAGSGIVQGQREGPVGGGFTLQPNAGGMVVRKFAMGGPVPGFGNRDTVPAMLTPGEFVLSRGDVSDIKNGLGNRITFVTNNYSSAQVGQPSVQRGSDGNTVITQTIRSVVKGMVRGGDLDSENGERYGMSPKPRGR